jgi:nucleotide-binding universal stress UspA family protein
MATIKKHGDEIKISYEVMSGHSVLYGIEKLIENEHYEFVVMGTSGASGLKKFLIGSNAADMVMNSPISSAYYSKWC